MTVALATRPVGAETGGGRPLEAGLYEGTVRHRRREPVDHAFSYPVAMVHFDVDHVDDALSVSPLASRGPFRPLRFDRRDHLGDPAVGLGDAVRGLVAERLGERPTGPVTCLAHLRTWGWCFNPIAVYWCHDPADPSSIVAQVLSVTNTPWKQRHAYVIDVGGETGRWEATFDKELHVSPFLDMDLTYRATSTPPDERLTVTLDARRGDRAVFDASLVATRRPLDAGAVLRLLFAHPFMTHRVSAGIHTQALGLWRRRVPVVHHPDGAPMRLRSRTRR